MAAVRLLRIDGAAAYTVSDKMCCSGWYADTEIVRNMSDEGRYNMLPAIAAGLGLDTTTNTALWKDAAILALNQVPVKTKS